MKKKLLMLSLLATLSLGAVPASAAVLSTSNGTQSGANCCLASNYTANCCVVSGGCCGVTTDPTRASNVVLANGNIIMFDGSVVSPDGRIISLAPTSVNK